MVSKIDADDAAAAFHEGAKVTEGLGLFQDGEGVWLTGDRKLHCIISDDLEENTRVGTTFVKLSGRVEETRTIANSHCAVRLITQLHTKLLKLSIRFRSLLDVVQKRDVIPRLDPGKIATQNFRNRLRFLSIVATVDRHQLIAGDLIT